VLKKMTLVATVAVVLLSAAAPPVHGIPAVVLSADKCWFVPPGFDAKATCSAWNAAQDQLATLLDAEHITHTNSGHFIQGRILGL
jgi:hypothetical protein